MAKRDYSAVPHYDLIVPNGEIEIASVFLFRGGIGEINLFLDACMDLKCNVRFVNENLECRWNTVNTDRSAIKWYVTVGSTPKVIEDYFRYLMKKERGEISDL